MKISFEWLKKYVKPDADADKVAETLTMSGSEVEDMEKAIMDGQAPRISLADSRANVATIVALLQSAKEDKPVRLEK